MAERNFISQKNYRRKKIAREVKEKFCELSDVVVDDVEQSEDVKYFTLPDESRVSVGNERFQCPEALFDPSLVSSQQDILYSNIVLSGGNTLFPGIQTRLSSELCRLVSDRNIRVVAPPERNSSAWRGGAILAQIPSFSRNWIYKSHYEEYGPDSIFQFCPI